MVAQVGLACRLSPSRAAGLVRSALILVEDMPGTLAAVESGELSEDRAEIVVRRCEVLTPEHRRMVDVELTELLRRGELSRLGDRELRRRVDAIAYRVDAASVVERCRFAESQRRVTIRPAPDAMCFVTALLPIAQGVAVHVALVQEATAARALGDDRSRGQVLADTFVARATGADLHEGGPVELQVVITDRALLSGATTPAHIPGYGTVPAPWVRDLVTPGHEEGSEDQSRVWVRRLFTHPDNGTLVAMDSQRRLFDRGIRRFLLARDGTCRTPWCDAPIRHLDHIVDHAAGGPTSVANGQGLCVRCNHVKQAAGWRARAEGGGPAEAGEAGAPGQPHTVVTTTPTGHSYHSTAPPVIPPSGEVDVSQLEQIYERLLAA